MDLRTPITPGTDIDVVLMLADGSTVGFTAQVRDFPGARENYDSNGSGGSMPMTPGSGG